MSELARFQDAFAAALQGEEAALSGWFVGDGAAGLSVYRNTVAKGVADSLAANFPTVERLAGPDWFRAAAQVFARAHPPKAPALVTYGAAFPAWLADFAPARSMPYLAAVAAADRAWTEAHVAAEAGPVGMTELAGLDEQALARTGAALHPSVRLLWFEDNSGALWRASRPPASPPDAFELLAQPTGLLVWRREGVVESRLLDPADLAFLAACRDGAALAEAAGAALGADAGADLSAIVADTVSDGLIASLQPLGGDCP